MGQQWPAAGLGALSAWDLLKKVAIIFITSTIVGLRSNNREGTQPCPSTENWIKDLLIIPPPPSEQDPVSPSVSLSHQEEQWPATGALGAADLGNGINPLGGGCH